MCRKKWLTLSLADSLSTSCHSPSLNITIIILANNNKHKHKQKWKRNETYDTIAISPHSRLDKGSISRQSPSVLDWLCTSFLTLVSFFRKRPPASIIISTIFTDNWVFANLVAVLYSCRCDSTNRPQRKFPTCSRLLLPRPKRTSNFLMVIVVSISYER